MRHYEEYIYKSRYSRWKDEEERREKWPETLSRYKEFFVGRVPEKYKSQFHNALDLVEIKEIMPSMRALWTAGSALEQDNTAGFNCAYTVIEKPRDFAEILYILMCGTGVGFSTERQYITELPVVPEGLTKEDVTYVVEDSRQGWAEAFEFLLSCLYDGAIPVFDYSQIRPKGARLKTFGGRASGPEPLKQLFEFTIRAFQKAQGRKLNSLEAYDIVTMTASVVIAGGVRRSATINLSNLSDNRMRTAKDGQFWIDHPHRSLSNNSVAYTEQPEISVFMEEWLNLMRSGSGERGIINREALKRAAARSDREDIEELGTNPCGEVILKPRQFCNLTEVVIRPWDSLRVLQTKVRNAVFLAVLQSTLKLYKYIGEEWLENAWSETLLGVSLTGLKDHPILSRTSEQAKVYLETLQDEAQSAAAEYAYAFDLPPATAVTTVKPSGTVSQLVDSSSGMHTRYAPYYIRRVRSAATDPLARFLAEQGVPHFPEVGETRENCRTVVFEFPIDASDSYVFRDDETAIEQLEYWLMVKQCWCDHNPSNTIFVKEDEWLEVGAWIYEHWDEIAGLSFLPYDGGVYQLAPYEEITVEEYEELALSFPYIDWSKLTEYEREDQTAGAREWACIGDKCEI